MISYTEKENYIGSTVNEILQQRQTDRETLTYTEILLLYYNDSMTGDATTVSGPTLVASRRDSQITGTKINRRFTLPCIWITKTFIKKT